MSPVRDERFLKDFIEQANRLDVPIFNLNDSSDLKAWLINIKEESGFHRVWLDPSLGTLPPLLEEALERLGLLRVWAPEPWEVQSPPDIALGIARADFGVAYSGSLAFFKANSLVTLAPVGLLALLKAQNIVPSYEGLFSSLSGPFPQILSLITGPSQTSDIEKKLIKGVHGPKWVAVLLLGQPD